MTWICALAIWTSELTREIRQSEISERQGGIPPACVKGKEVSTSRSSHVALAVLQHLVA